MDRDEILRQGMDMAGKLRDAAGAQVAEHEEQIKEAVGKVADFVNDKTGGQYTEQVSKATEFLEHGVSWLAEQGRDGSAPEQPPPSA